MSWGERACISPLIVGNALQEVCIREEKGWPSVAVQTRNSFCLFVCFSAEGCVFEELD